MSLLRHNNMVILLPRIQYGPVSAKSVQEIRVCIINCYVLYLHYCLNLHCAFIWLVWTWETCGGVLLSLNTHFKALFPCLLHLFWFYFTQMFMHVNCHSYFKKLIPKYMMGLFFVFGGPFNGLWCLWLVILIKVNQQTLKFQNSWISTVCFNTVFDIY